MKCLCRLWKIQIMLLIALLLGGVQPVAALAEEEERQGLRPDAPAYALAALTPSAHANSSSRRETNRSISPSGIRR